MPGRSNHQPLPRTNFPTGSLTADFSPTALCITSDSRCRKRVSRTNAASGTWKREVPRTQSPAPDCVQLQFARHRGIQRDRRQTTIPIGLPRSSFVAILLLSSDLTARSAKRFPASATRTALHRKCSRLAIPPTCSDCGITQESQHCSSCAR